MSGFEVIGVVLALYPVVLDAIRVHQELKSGQGIRDLIAEVKTEQTVFQDHVAHLLGPLIPFNDIKPFLDPKSNQFSRWRSAQFRAAIEGVYGQDKGSLLLLTVQEIKKELNTIKDDLKFVLRQRDTLRSRICVAFQTMRHTREGSAMKARLTKLFNLNERLQRCFVEPEVLFHLANRVGGGYRLPMLQQQSYNHASEVYRALNRSYRCACTGSHVVKFRLPDLPAQEETPKAITSDACFEVVFGVEESSEERVDGLRTEAIGLQRKLIQYQESPQRSPEASVTSLLPLSLSHASTETESQYGLLSMSGTFTNSSWMTGTTSITTSSRSYSISPQEEFGDNSRKIEDLCNETRLVEERDPRQECAKHIGTITASDELQYRLTSQKSGDSPVATGMVSLDEVIGNEDLRLTRRNRLTLAVKLSVGLLQLAATPWIDSRWSWTDLSIAGFDAQHLDSASLFIARHFYSSSNNLKDPLVKRVQVVPTLLDFVPGSQMLIKLGCSLIELAFGRRLSSVSQQTPVGGVDALLAEVMAANAILESGRLKDEEGGAYHQVVATCLKQQIPQEDGFGMKSLNVHDSHFQQDISRAIIEPLHEIWRRHRDSQ